MACAGNNVSLVDLLAFFIHEVSVAGAITTMDPAQLEVPATNIVNTLAGRVAGVIGVQSSGEPGKNISEFWVRGIGTFGANSGALVLIDGLEGSLSQIDAADVEVRQIIVLYDDRAFKTCDCVIGSVHTRINGTEVHQRRPVRFGR